jgi:hypothetical protein
VAQALARIQPACRWFAQQLVPASWYGAFPARCPGANQGPPSAQSRFASGRGYRPEEDMVCLLEGRYPFVVARIDQALRFGLETALLFSGKHTPDQRCLSLI